MRNQKHGEYGGSSERKKKGLESETENHDFNFKIPNGVEEATTKGNDSPSVFAFQTNFKKRDYLAAN